jgi:hypothetical protein
MFTLAFRRNEKFYTCCDEPYLDISEFGVVGTLFELEGG